MSITCDLIALYMYVWNICVCYMLRVFDPGRLLVVRVGNLKRINMKLRVFDPGRLLVIRVGNLKRINMKLRVFDPGHLLMVRVGN